MRWVKSGNAFINKTKYNMKNGIKNVLLIAVIAVVIFYGLQGCFWLLNKQSSVANVLGFLGMAGLVTFTFYEVKEIIKDLTK